MAEKTSDKIGQAQLTSRLWTIAGKLHGVGELFSMSQAEPPLSEEGCQGISHILLETAKELDAIRGMLEQKDED